MSLSVLPSSTSALLPLDTIPTLSYKERARRSIHLASYQLGISALYARFRREAVATVLMYHSIPTQEESHWIDPCNSLSAQTFEQQMRFLSRYRHVISIDQLVQKLSQGKPIKRGTVAITFDDGYLNNLTVAAPILAKYNLPATLYLATGYVEGGKNQWADTLYSAFRARSEHRLALADWDSAIPDSAIPDSTLQDWNLTDAQQLSQAHTALVMYLIQADVARREALLAEIDKQLKPVAYPPRLTMNWEEVRALNDQYPNITLGVHTANHLDLRTHSEKTAEEMSTSIQQMVEALGVRPQHFAFPYNRTCQKSQAQVKAADLSSAVMVAEDPVVRTHTSPYAMPRLEAPRSMAILKSWTNGGFPSISRWLFNRPWVTPY
ncbi:MAG: polysaccharide deacetylase family protein [Cyanobacteria bacterium P01_D01_bin.105]